MKVVRISDDALALACGADDVAAAFAAAGCSVERVSSWGMHWLEPLAEIDGKGFGPLAACDVAAVLSGTTIPSFTCLPCMLSTVILMLSPICRLSPARRVRISISFPVA